MTWLAPLYLAGALAVAAPILFHLWRRTPRGTRSFSTLMFLTPSPPRVTSLSKVEHWLLLLLRAAALMLLALAFARPVLRIPQAIPVAGDETEFVAILVDTSASMQRSGLWPQVAREVQEKLGTLPPSAIIGLYHFDDRWTSDLSLPESEKLPPASRSPLVMERLKQLAATWKGSQLGEGLVRTAQAVQEAQAGRPLPCPQRLWLVSDLPAGSNLAALREFDWPQDLPVELVTIVPQQQQKENAGVQLVTAAADGRDDSMRVRISNAASSSRQKFSLRWGDEAATPCLDLVVPPGQSRVVALPAPPTAEAGRRVVLQGDEEPFDNELWLPVRQPRQCTVVYLGSETVNDPEGLRYYLQRALESNPSYDVAIADGTEPVLTTEPPVLAVVTDDSAATRELLPKLIQAGTDLVIVPQSAGMATGLWELCGAGLIPFEEAAGDDYVLWSQIDFESPWFAPFAEAQFSDFTGIHFWHHRIPQGDLPAGSEVIVRFDDRAPAIVRWPLAKANSQLWYFASGWQPKDSQLARSSKFVPLMWRMLEGSLGDLPHSSSQTVGEPLPRPTASSGLSVTLPDGTSRPWPDEAAAFAATDRPGRYEIVTPEATEVVAINLPADESRTDPLPLEQLESHGLKLSATSARPALPAKLEQLRQQQVQELEERQQLWRWLLLAAAGLLILETLIGARVAAVPQET